MSTETGLLAGIKVVEFTHMVMGPAAGLVLADLGAEVIKVEPVGGDKTRRLRGSGAGYFSMYNRNKKSLAVDLKSPEGKGIALKLIEQADVFIENFRPGALDKLGFGYDALSSLNPQLIYCSEKGFLDGPYAHRTALDEVAQMMGGLAYMTGPPGRPLRAGSSVIDVTGGMLALPYMKLPSSSSASIWLNTRSPERPLPQCLLVSQPGRFMMYSTFEMMRKSLLVWFPMDNGRRFVTHSVWRSGPRTPHWPPIMTASPVVTRLFLNCGLFFRASPRMS